MSAPFADCAAHYMIADRRAQGVADSVLAAKRQHRHRQPLRGADLSLGQPFRAEIHAIQAKPARKAPGTCRNQ